MTPIWEAENIIEPARALQIIREQFPTLNAQKIQRLGVGWDNTAYLVNDQFVFRFPRRQVSVPLLETEFHVLSEIAPYLPLPIPQPKWKGTATSHYPWPFVGYQLLKGVTACQAQLSVIDRIKLAQPLAHFLAHLHAIPLSENLMSHLPGDIFNRLKVERLVAGILKNLEELRSLELVNELKRYDKILDHVEDLFDVQKSVKLVHGDFYVRHLLVDSTHALTAVIDWGDVHLNDPAIDLAVAHTFLPLQAHDQFRMHYGTITDAAWRLARLRALYHSSLLALYGHHTQDSILLREELWSLHQISLQE